MKNTKAFTKTLFKILRKEKEGIIKKENRNYKKGKIEIIKKREL